MDFFSRIEAALQRSAPKGSETKVRVTTGLVGGAVLLILLLTAGHFGVAVVSALLASVMAWELGRVFIRSFDKVEKLNAIIGLAWLIVFANLLLPKSLFEGLILGSLGLFAFYLATAERHAENLKTHFDELVFSIFTLVYAVCFIGFLPLIRLGNGGLQWLILFLLIVWANDTGAYFAGKKWGQRKLYPLISPKKTLEGALGGLVVGLFIALLFKLVFFRDLWVCAAGFASTPVGVSSQIGDLCESLLKRAYSVKDSSQMLPGHGGILDRFDGVLFSAPVMYLCTKIFGS